MRLHTLGSSGLNVRISKPLTAEQEAYVYLHVCNYCYRNAIIANIFPVGAALLARAVEPEYGVAHQRQQ